jgi:predicted metalloprotease with PDZ domain
MPATFTDYDWSSWVRGMDYYEEGALIWLEAGAIIHDQTGGRRSLDDFLADFYGGAGGRATVKTYIARDVFDALGRIAPYDWAGFFQTRLTSLAPTPPLGGLTRSGWRLVYDATPNGFIGSGFMLDTIGLQADGSGLIGDIDRHGAPYAAGIVPGMKIVKVNGKNWSAKDFKALLAAAKAGDQLALTTEYAGVTQAFQIAAGAGLRYPHLQRIAGTPDTLTAYLAPHAMLEPAAGK